MGQSERAVVVKTTKITIETESLLVVHKGKSIVTWCPACDAEVEAMAVEGDSLWEGMPSAFLREWLATRFVPFGARFGFGQRVPMLLDATVILFR